MTDSMADLYVSSCNLTENGFDSILVHDLGVVFY